MFDKLIKLIFLFFVFVIPVVLILAQVIPFEYRFYVLLIATIVVFIYTRLMGVFLSELGWRKKNLKISFLKILPMTLSLSLVMLLFYFLGWIRSTENQQISWLFYLFYVFISCPSQEFLYRGFLFWFLPMFELNSRAIIVTSAVLYSFVHAIYWDIPTLIITLVIGFFWSQNYEKYQNLYSVIFSHSLLGAIAIMIGLI